MKRIYIYGSGQLGINSASADKKINNGAYFAPAVMIADVMSACAGDTALELPLNRVITGGEFSGCSAQLLAKIQAGNITPLRLDFSAEETKLLKDSIAGQIKSREAISLSPTKKRLLNFK